MENEFRYKVEHMGDYFVDMLTKVSYASKSSAKAALLRYDFYQGTKKKETLIRDIGTRVSQIIKDNPSLSQDAKISELLGLLDQTETLPPDTAGCGRWKRFCLRGRMGHCRTCRKSNGNK